MAKKLCERPRIEDGWGGMDKYVRNNKIRVQDLEEHEEEEETVIDIDSGRKHQPMSRGRGSKELGENLAPLYRFLDKQVNRHWDDVYSEIRKNVRAESATQLHILQHVDGRVWGSKETLYEKDGGIYYGAGFRQGLIELRKGALFVHPRTKILCKYKKNTPVKYWPSEDEVVKIEDLVYFAKLDGIWHEIAYEQKWAHQNNKFQFNSSFYNQGLIGHPYALSHVRQIEYTKRVVPKKILSQMGLKNDKK